MFDVIPVTTSNPVACGATSLKMLLEYYGISVPLDELIDECNTRLIGCTGKDILRTARAHGMQDISAWKMDAPELIRQDRPAIIYWMHMHFVVFCGRDENGNVWICNPARGRFPLDEGTFCSLYTGIAFFNGEPHDLPESEIATAADYEAALDRLGVVV